MRSTIIKTAIAISISVALFPQLALATTPSFSCSSNLVVSLDNGYSASCDGDFSFTDGALQNDTSISLTAGGLINIGTNFELASPIVNLTANSIQIDGQISQNLEINTSTLPRGYLRTLDWQPNSGFGLTQINYGSHEIVDLYFSQIYSVLQTMPGGNLSLGSGSSSSGTVLSGVGGSIVIRPDVTGNLISNTGAIIITNGSGIIVSSVPEPSTYLMMLLGLMPISLMRKRNTN